MREMSAGGGPHQWSLRVLTGPGITLSKSPDLLISSTFPMWVLSRDFGTVHALQRTPRGCGLLQMMSPPCMIITWACYSALVQAHTKNHYKNDRFPPAW